MLEENEAFQDMIIELQRNGKIAEASEYIFILIEFILDFKKDCKETWSSSWMPSPKIKPIKGIERSD